MRCSVCSSPQVAQVDALLDAGTPIRQVARVTGLARTTLGRHNQHKAPTSGRFALIPGGDGPTGPTDPLAEAFALAGSKRRKALRVNSRPKLSQQAR